MTNSKVSIATLARTAALAFALANQVSSAAGKPLLPIESSEVEQFVTTGLTIAPALLHGGRTTVLPPPPSKAISG